MSDIVSLTSKSKNSDITQQFLSAVWRNERRSVATDLDDIAQYCSMSETFSVMRQSLTERFGDDVGGNKAHMAAMGISVLLCSQNLDESMRKGIRDKTSDLLHEAFIRLVGKSDETDMHKVLGFEVQTNMMDSVDALIKEAKRAEINVKYHAMRYPSSNFRPNMIKPRSHKEQKPDNVIDFDHE